MKTKVLLILSLVINMTLQAQVYKTIHITTAGTLNSILTPQEDTMVTNLTLTGNIDARDFVTMRDSMSNLTGIDLSGATIVEYKDNNNNDYQANTIPQLAFSMIFGTTYLISIVLPSSINEIGNGAFMQCVGLTTITIPSSVKNLGIGTFSRCENLTSITIPNYIDSIGDDFLSICKNLSSFYIPPSVTYIGHGAFYNCSSLITISIPSSVTSINSEAFFNCTGLTSIYSYSVTPVDLPTKTNVFGNIDTNNCILFVPKGSKAIYASANQWKSFTHIVEMGGTQISKKLTCTAGNLSSILGESKDTIMSLTITGSIDARDFKTMRDSMPILMEIDLSGGTIENYRGTMGTADTISTYYPANAIPNYAFLKKDTYKGKSNLTTIILPTSITSIGIYAFGFCRSLIGNISISSSVDSIGSFAFSHCSSLTSINIPSSVINIGADCFNSFSGLTNIDAVNPNYSSIDGVLFNKKQTMLIQCPTIKTGSYLVPSSVNIIGEDAFVSCSKLTSVTLPPSVCTILSGAFAMCSGLHSINIPSSLDTIGLFIFVRCYGLSSIYVYSTIPKDFLGFDVNMKTCILYVPFGTKATYKLANGWNSFKHIVEMREINLSSSSVSLSKEAGSTVTVNVTDTATWTATSNKLWLTLNPVSTTSSDETLTITASANTADTARTAIVTVLAFGAVSTITVTQAAGTGTPVEEVNNNNISIYPNPTSTSFTVNIEEKATVNVYNNTGDLVLNAIISGKEAIPLNTIPSGIYWLKITTENTVITRKLVVK